MMLQKDMKNPREGKGDNWKRIYRAAKIWTLEILKRGHQKEIHRWLKQTRLKHGLMMKDLLLLLLLLLARCHILSHKREGNKESARVEITNIHIICWYRNRWRPANQSDFMRCGEPHQSLNRDDNVQTMVLSFFLSFFPVLTNHNYWQEERANQ